MDRHLLIFKLYVIISSLLAVVLVQAQSGKRVKTITIFEIRIAENSDMDTLTKKITNFSVDSTIIDQTVTTKESDFFGFPIDHRDSIVLKDKRIVFRQVYGRKRQPAYRTQSTYKLNSHAQVIEETDSVYQCYVSIEEDSGSHRDSLYAIHKATYHYNSSKQLVREVQQSDILNEFGVTNIRYWYNRNDQLKKSVVKGAETEVSRFYYNRHGLLIKTLVKGPVSGSALLFYDDRGRIVKKEENFSDGKETLLFTYDENGNIWRSEHIGTEGCTLKVALFEYY